MNRLEVGRYRRLADVQFAGDVRLLPFFCVKLRHLRAAELDPRLFLGRKRIMRQRTLPIAPKAVGGHARW